MRVLKFSNWILLSLFSMAGCLHPGGSAVADTLGNLANKAAFSLRYHFIKKEKSGSSQYSDTGIVPVDRLNLINK
jgi:hypothetical protein